MACMDLLLHDKAVQLCSGRRGEYVEVSSMEAMLMVAVAVRQLHDAAGGGRSFTSSGLGALRRQSSPRQLELQHHHHRTNRPPPHLRPARNSNIQGCPYSTTASIPSR